MSQAQYEQYAELQELAGQVPAHRLAQADELLRQIVACPSWCVDTHDEESPWWLHHGETHKFETRTSTSPLLIELRKAEGEVDPNTEERYTAEGIGIEDAIWSVGEVRELIALLTRLVDELEASA